MAHIREPEVGLDVALEAITQGQCEALLRAERDLRRNVALTERALTVAITELVQAALAQALRKGIAPAGAEVGALAEDTAPHILRRIQEAEDAREMTAVEQAGLSVRAAARVGMLGDVREEAVEGWRPGVVLGLAQQIAAALAEALTVPKA